MFVLEKIKKEEIKQKGEDNIRNIIIIGTPRSGKTTLTNKILSKYGYTLIDADAIREVIMEEEGIHDIATCAKRNSEIEEKSQRISRELFQSMKKDLEKGNIGIILDDTRLSIEQCEEMYGQEDNLIYCLGTAKTTPNEMFRKIRENDTYYEWSHYFPDYMIMDLCENAIRESKENRVKCQTRENIKYWDTSQDREQVLQEIMKEIEEKIFQNKL